VPGVRPAVCNKSYLKCSTNTMHFLPQQMASGSGILRQRQQMTQPRRLIVPDASMLRMHCRC
jgi:hypothetical protein